jgi:hypothetical protein
MNQTPRVNGGVAASIETTSHAVSFSEEILMNGELSQRTNGVYNAVNGANRRLSEFSMESYTTGTIDAEVVEEIVEEAAPLEAAAAAVVNGEGVARLVSPSPRIPEVEPEVDIDEVHVDRSRISVSALTTSLWAATALSETGDHQADDNNGENDGSQEDAKPKASPSKPLLSPSIPERRDFAEERKVATGAPNCPISRRKSIVAPLPWRQRRKHPATRPTRSWPRLTCLGTIIWTTKSRTTCQITNGKLTESIHL